MKPVKKGNRKKHSRVQRIIDAAEALNCIVLDPLLSKAEAASMTLIEAYPWPQFEDTLTTAENDQPGNHVIFIVRI